MDGGQSWGPVARGDGGAQCSGRRPYPRRLSRRHASQRARGAPADRTSAPTAATREAPRSDPLRRHFVAARSAAKCRRRLSVNLSRRPPRRSSRAPRSLTGALSPRFSPPSTLSEGALSRLQAGRSRPSLDCPLRAAQPCP